MKSFLTDSETKRNAAIKAEEQSLLRKKRLALVATRRLRDDSTKIDTVKTFLALGGNLSLTSGATGIPYGTLKQWKATNWWTSVVAELKKEDRLEISAKTKTILDKSLSQLVDRLEHGDWFFDVKTGKLRRKPVPVKDLHKISVDMMDRKEKLDKGMEENINPESNDDRLRGLAERFAALALKAAEKQVSQNTGEVIDIEFKESGA